MEEIKDFGEFQDKNQNESVKNFEEYQIDEKFSLAKLKKDLADVLKELTTFDEDSVNFKDVADCISGKKSIKQIFAEKDKIADEKNK